MIAISFALGLRELPASTAAWHLCTVIIPRRTITGRLVRGQVWRRPQRPSLVIQKIYLGASRRIGWDVRWTKAVEHHEHQDGG
jgi:hypothetical protein